jgi:hypothetical protein
MMTVTHPCGRAYAWEWYHRLLLERGAIYKHDTYIYMHMLTYTCKYCVCKYMYVSVCIRQYMHVLITYHVSFWLLQRICMHCLPTNPIPVLNVDGTEKLDQHVHFRHVFQPQKRLLKVFSAELPVQTVGSRKLVDFPTLTTNGKVLLRVTRRAFPILVSSSTSPSSGVRWRKW